VHTLRESRLASFALAGQGRYNPIELPDQQSVTLQVKMLRRLEAISDMGTSPHCKHHSSRTIARQHRFTKLLGVGVSDTLVDAALTM